MTDIHQMNGGCNGKPDSRAVFRRQHDGCDVPFGRVVRNRPTSLLRWYATRFVGGTTARAKVRTEIV